MTSRITKVGDTSVLCPMLLIILLFVDFLNKYRYTCIHVSEKQLKSARDKNSFGTKCMIIKQEILEADTWIGV